jgi:peptide/nickel transport system ATP-binding protein/oligopeptide transport system ATP-binding protein
MQKAILEVRNLNTTFTAKRAGKTYRIKAVDDLSFSVYPGEVLGIVGETGCGKTTVGRTILRLETPQSGAVLLKGRDILTEGSRKLRTLRLKVRMVFQDPFASLNPRRSVGDSVAETGDIHGIFKSRSERRELVAEALTQVGLDASFATRFPHELSGGQRQRVGIARAILPPPDLIIADEPVSALDVSVQAQVLNLLADLKERMGLTMLFISHDLGVVGQVSDRVAVMYMGHLVEIAESKALFAEPLHPYTSLLIASVPKLDPTQRIKGGLEKGEPPSRFEQLAGCPFYGRCPIASERCRDERPPLRPFQGGRLAACHNI